MNKIISMFPVLIRMSSIHLFFEDKEPGAPDLYPELLGERKKRPSQTEVHKIALKNS